MQGQILQVDAGRTGLILGDDGSRYRFTDSDWKGLEEPAPGRHVDFIAADGQATEVFPLPAQDGAPWPPPPPVPPVPPRGSDAGSSVLLGLLGIACLVLGFVIPILPTIAAFVLGLVGADNAKRHDNGPGLILSRVAWVGALVLLVAAVALIAWVANFAWPYLEELLGHLWRNISEDAARQVVLAVVAG